MMVERSDLERLASELNAQDNAGENFDPEIWFAEEGLSVDAVKYLARVFRSAMNNGVTPIGVCMAAFHIGWEAAKQYA